MTCRRIVTPQQLWPRPVEAAQSSSSPCRAASRGLRSTILAMRVKQPAPEPAGVMSPGRFARAGCGLGGLLRAPGLASATWDGVPQGDGRREGSSVNASRIRRSFLGSAIAQQDRTCAPVSVATRTTTSTKTIAMTSATAAAPSSMGLTPRVPPQSGSDPDGWPRGLQTLGRGVSRRHADYTEVVI